MPKPRGEVLITARAYPRRPPQIACSTRISMGKVDKTLYVVGDRLWKRGVATDPTPFAEMPITWSRAFGGARFPDNPVGKGHEPVEADGASTHALPNVEDPAHLVRSPGDRPAPAGFGAYDLMWPQRFSKIGTYDAAWLEHRAPGLADDLDPTFFNAAPDDQQVAERFVPGQAFRLENMHPDKGVLESALPARIARCFLTLRGREEAGLVEVPMELETVHLFPHAERGVVLFRGVHPATDDDAADVVHALLAAEAPGAPRDREHYVDVLRRRLDKKGGALASLREQDLLPSSDGRPAYPEASEIDEMAELVAQKGAKQRNLRNRAEADRARLVEEVARYGLDASVVPPLPPPEPELDFERLPDIVANAEAMAEEQGAKAEAERERAIEAARAICASEGKDFDALVEDERAKSAGPPKFTAEGQIDWMRDLAELTRKTGGDASSLEAQLADATLRPKLRRTEEALREAYVGYADLFPKARRMREDDAKIARDRVQAAAAAKQSLADEDLTGADLSGLDLAGIDLHGAMLESADLSRADLRGANLQGAVLAKADLRGALLDGARLGGANIGAADLSRASLRDVDLRAAVLRAVELRGADFTGAQIGAALILDAQLAGVTFERLDAAGAMFIKCDLSGSILDGADLTKAIFLETPVRGASFVRAKLAKALFLTCHGEGARFDEAEAENLRFVKDCAFEEATFRGAKLARANFRGADLAGADFTDAAIDAGDFSEANLRGARLTRAVLRGALLVRTELRDADLAGANLLGAILQKAGLRGASLAGANLARADLLRVDVDEGTDLAGALLDQIRFVKREAPHEPG
jgi:uncharacterized protein YjbI with pentapeptide repeats